MKLRKIVSGIEGAVIAMHLTGCIARLRNVGSSKPQTSSKPIEVSTRSKGMELSVLEYLELVRGVDAGG